ncbi:MAG: hypothetical protein ABW321_06235, partial [Polyangiales bacterium]
MTATTDDEHAGELGFHGSQRHIAGPSGLDGPRAWMEPTAARSRDYMVARASAEAFHTHLRATVPARQRPLQARQQPLSIITDTRATDNTLARRPGQHADMVLVAVEEQSQRLSAARFQHQLMCTPAWVAARTEAAVSGIGLLAEPVEGADQSLLLGATNRAIPAFADCERACLRLLGQTDVEPASVAADAWLDGAGLAGQLTRARTSGDGGLMQSTFDRFVSAWQREARLCTFGEAVAELMNWPIMDSSELPVSPAVW